jgi:hypothetical protein
MLSGSLWALLFSLVLYGLLESLSFPFALPLFELLKPIPFSCLPFLLLLACCLGWVFVFSGARGVQ